MAPVLAVPIFRSCARAVKTKCVDQMVYLNKYRAIAKRCLSVHLVCWAILDPSSLYLLGGSDVAA